MALIRKDKHSLYAKVGGYVVRPIFPPKHNHKYSNGTQYKEEEKVPARHNGGRFCSVGDETWYIHGDYLSTGHSSEECWLYDDRYTL